MAGRSTATTPSPSRLVILGYPVAHSLSPVFQNAALEATGKALRYERLEVAPEHLAETLDQLARDNAAGNVTIPHKEAVAERAVCSPLARRVGAVNTFWHESGELIGHNTDVGGAIATIRALRPLGIAGARCTLLGAGGSAAAVLVALHELGCTDVAIFARTPARAERLTERVGVAATVSPTLESALEDSVLVINATPVGLTDDAMPVAPRFLPENATVFDLVYRKGGTAWARACRLAGHPAEDGLRMLLEQGADAYSCWFGEPAPRAAMWESVGLTWTERVVPT